MNSLERVGSWAQLLSIPYNKHPCRCCTFEKCTINMNILGGRWLMKHETGAHPLETRSLEPNYPAFGNEVLKTLEKREPEGALWRSGVSPVWLLLTQMR